MAAEAAAAAAARNHDAAAAAGSSGSGLMSHAQQLAHSQGFSASRAAWQHQQQQVLPADSPGMLSSSSLAMHLPTAAAVALAAALQNRSSSSGGAMQGDVQLSAQHHAILHNRYEANTQQHSQQQQQQPEQQWARPGHLAAVQVQQQQQPFEHASKFGHLLVNRRESVGFTHPETSAYISHIATSAGFRHPSDLRQPGTGFSHHRPEISSPEGFSQLDPNRVGSGGFSDSPAEPGSTAADAAAGAVRSGSRQNLRDVAAAAALVGKMIKVWWPLDQEWYTATVEVGSGIGTHVVHLQHCCCCCCC